MDLESTRRQRLSCRDYARNDAGGARPKTGRIKRGTLYDGEMLSAKHQLRWRDTSRNDKATNPSHAILGRGAACLTALPSRFVEFESSITNASRWRSSVIEMEGNKIAAAQSSAPNANKKRRRSNPLRCACSKAKSPAATRVNHTLLRKSSIYSLRLPHSHTDSEAAVKPKVTSLFFDPVSALASFFNLAHVNGKWFERDGIQ